MIYLFILEIIPLSVVLFANIFFHFEGCFFILFMVYFDFPGGSEGKVSACNAGDLGLIPGSGKSPGEGNGNPLQYSCLDNPMDGEAW